MDHRIWSDGLSRTEANVKGPRFAAPQSVEPSGNDVL